METGNNNFNKQEVLQEVREQSYATTQTIIPPTFESTKNNKKYIILAAIIVATIGCLGVVIGWAVNKSDKNENYAKEDAQNETSDIEDEKDEAKTAEEIVAKVRATARDRFPDETIYDSPDSGLIVKSPGTDYYIHQDTGVVGFVYGGDVDGSIAKTVDKILKANKFDTVISVGVGDSDGYARLYSKDDTVCEFREVLSPELGVNFKCAEFDDTNPNIATIASFCSGENAESCADKTLSFSSSGAVGGIRDSLVVPYQTTSLVFSYFGVNRSGWFLLFYRTSPTSPWILAGVNPEASPCSQYDTDDLKNAFAGLPCYDDDNQTTVQPAKK
ncbi:MAG: hypothetical protein LBM97_00210 [Candidatus Nomurabacteria bacterium]|jgi:hypothetical protein|nr:hypothetical protein [Candidatus Nomurabacteria bacterium]